MSKATTPTTSSAFMPSRRQLGAFGAAAAALGTAAAAPLVAATGVSRSPQLNVIKVEGNLFRPEAGKHPGLVMFSSAAASRSANAAVAHQLASRGWAVMLVDAPLHADPARLERDARTHVAWLSSQPGVAVSKPVSNAHGISEQGYVLQSFSAAHPALSLASREKRRAANCSGVLFAVPAAVLAKAEARRNSLHVAARSLHQLAA